MKSFSAHQQEYCVERSVSNFTLNQPTLFAFCSMIKPGTTHSKTVVQKVVYFSTTIKSKSLLLSYLKYTFFLTKGNIGTLIDEQLQQ